MVVSQNVTAGINDGTGPGTALLGNRFEEPVQAKGFSGNIYNTMVIALIHINVVSLVVRESCVPVHHPAQLLIGVCPQLKISLVECLHLGTLFPPDLSIDPCILPRI